MSWSFEVPPVKASEFAAKAREALANYTFEWNPEGKDQGPAAVEAAIALVESGKVAPPDKFVQAFIGGHGNAEHVGNDAINVSVYQIPYDLPAGTGG